MNLANEEGRLVLHEQQEPALLPCSPEFVYHLGAFLVHAATRSHVHPYLGTSFVQGRQLHVGNDSRPSVYRAFRTEPTHDQACVAKVFPATPYGEGAYDREVAALEASKGIRNTVHMEEYAHLVIILSPFCREVDAAYWDEFAVIVKALGNLHARGWTHNDIRPPNILRVDSDALLLSDMGHATERGTKLPDVAIWVSWRNRKVMRHDLRETKAEEVDDVLWQERCKQDLDAVISCGIWYTKPRSRPDPRDSVALKTWFETVAKSSTTVRRCL